MPEFAIVSFINTALLPILIMFALSLASSYALSYHFQESLLGLVLFSFLSGMITIVLSFVVMLNRNEKRQTLELIKKRIKR
jgi:hypothetical protein